MKCLQGLPVPALSEHQTEPGRSKCLGFNGVADSRLESSSYSNSYTPRELLAAAAGTKMSFFFCNIIGCMYDTVGGGHTHDKQAWIKTRYSGFCDQLLTCSAILHTGPGGFLLRLTGVVSTPGLSCFCLWAWLLLPHPSLPHIPDHPRASGPLCSFHLPSNEAVEACVHLCLFQATPNLVQR